VQLRKAESEGDGEKIKHYEKKYKELLEKRMQLEHRA